MDAETSAAPLKVLGRYALHDAIASGGMATVHFGRLLGPVGFARTVAIKRLHEKVAHDPEFTAMFLDEARLAARIRHPNVVQTLDVVALEGELFLVMEYVPGESLARLLTYARESGTPIPIPIMRTIMAGALHGLHAAHEAKNGRGQPLAIIHRDVSPQNILVGADGVPRVLDFGIAKAAQRVHTTRDGALKGKLAYMAPEQLRREEITRAVDVFASGIVLWEGLTGQRLFNSKSEGRIVAMVLAGVSEPPSKLRPEVSPELDAIVLKALSSEPADRFATARDMARALEKLGPLVPASEIGEWIAEMAGGALAERASTIARIESSPKMAAAAPTSSVPSVPATVADEDEAETIALTELTVPSRSSGPFVVLGALLLLVVVGVVTISRRSTPSTPSTESAASGTAHMATNTADSPRAIPDPPPPDPAASAATSAKAGGSPRSPHVTTAGAHGKHPRATCDPPYVIDAQGNRRYKRECLR